MSDEKDTEIIEGPPDNTLDGLPDPDPVMTGEAAREAEAKEAKAEEKAEAKTAPKSK